MATTKQTAARARFARLARSGKGKVGRRAKSSARQRKRKRQRHSDSRH